MFKTIGQRVWAFDAEWVPDPVLARRLHGLADDATDADALRAAWAAAGATPERPRPFVKTALSRIVSISAVERLVGRDGAIRVRLLSLPRHHTDGAEAAVLAPFLEAIARFQPQLVGFNSKSSDLRILVQRGVIAGLSVPGFARQPEKFWEGVDYHHPSSQDHVDLADAVGGRSRGMPSLHELATACGIPGKLGVDGERVADLWLAGQLDEIVAYNECDALTTYLLWLRVAHFGGFFDAEQYLAEQERVRDLLEAADPSADHLARFAAAWQALTPRPE